MAKPIIDNDILKIIIKKRLNDLAEEIIAVQPIDENTGRIFTMDGIVCKNRICIYSDINRYNELSSEPDNIIIVTAPSSNIARMIVETAVECKIDIEMRETIYDTWRVFCVDDIFQSTFKLKYG